MEVEGHTLDYEIGDFITGKDRSYTRSIYRAIAVTVDRTARKFVAHVEFEMIAYEGRKWEKSKENKNFKVVFEKAQTYRTATKQEMIEAGAISKSIDFIKE